MDKNTEKYPNLDLSLQLGKFAVLDYEMHHYHDYSWAHISSKKVRAYSAPGYLKQAIEEKLVTNSDLIRGIRFWIDKRRKAEPLAIKLIQRCKGAAFMEEKLTKLTNSEESILIMEIIKGEKSFAELERSDPLLFEQFCHEMHRRLALLRSRKKTTLSVI